MNEACRAGDADLVMELLGLLGLLGLGIEPPVLSDCLHTATEYGHVCVIKVLVHFGVDVDCISSQGGETPLHVAVRAGNTDVVQALLDLGACINAVDDDGNTPIHACAASGGSIELLTLLVELGGNFLLSNNEHKTAAAVAQENGREELVKYMERRLREYI